MQESTVRMKTGVNLSLRSWLTGDIEIIEIVKEINANIG